MVPLDGDLNKTSKKGFRKTEVRSVKQRRRRRGAWAALRRVLFRTTVCLLVLAAGAAGYLQFVGIPRGVKALWIESLERQGLYVSVGRVTFNVFGVARARDFACFDHAARVQPLLEFGEVLLDIDVFEWLKRGSGFRGLTISSGVARVCAMHPLHEAPPDQVLEVRDLNATLARTGTGVEVRSLRAMVLGMQVIGSGEVLLDGDAGFGPAFPIPSLDSVLSRCFPGSDSGGISLLIEQLNDMRFLAPPAIDLSFLLQPATMESSEVRLTGRGRETRVRGVGFDAWRFAGAYSDQQLSIHDLELLAGGLALRGRGEVDFGEGCLEAEVSTDLPSSHLTSLMPVDWRDRLAEMGWHLGGGVRAEMRIARAPIESLWRSLSGSVFLDSAVYQGIPIHSGSLDFSCDDPWFRFKDIDFRIGAEEEDSGAISGAISWNMNDDSYEASLRTQVDYLLIAPVLPEGQVRLARHLQFTEEPLQAQVDFTGRRGSREQFVMNGAVAGTNFYYKGTFVNRFSSTLAYTNRLLVMDPFHASRDEGDFDGALRIDLKEKRVDIDVVSAVDPKAAARASHKAFEGILASFEFNGPSRTEVVGSVYFGTNGVTQLRASTVAERMSIYSFETDAMSFDVAWSNRSVSISNIKGLLYGGTVEGYYNVFPEDGAPSESRYAFDLEGRGINFEEVVRTLLHREGEPYQGIMGLRLKLTGILGSNRGRSAAGHGSISVREGHIQQIPLFGGLSRILAKVYPGLGFMRQTDLRSDFEVSGLTLKSEKVLVEGNIFTIQGDGTYQLQSKELNFDVEFKLLRDGAVGTVVQLVTTPISKLLEFDLKGTPEDPRWRPKSLPKELFTDHQP